MDDAAFDRASDLCFKELEVTVPWPLPSFVTVKVNRCRVKVAATDFAPFIETVHVASETSSHPLQPAIQFFL